MYLFKMNAKTNLLPSVFEDLKEFLDSGIGKPEPTYKRTENHFVVSFEPEEDIEIEELEKMADESSQYVDDVSMAVEEDPEPYFEVETVNEESETGMTDSNEYEDLIQPENIKKEEAQIETNENTYVFEPKALSSLTKLQQQHLREENYTKLTCCDVGFKDSKCFERHTKAHENFDAIAPFLESFTCSNCRIMFSNSEDLESHEAQHEESSELEEIILIERQSAFDDHILKPIAKPTEVEPAEADDDDEELFLCGHCGKRLSELNLKVHLLFFHTHSVVCPHDKRCFDGIKQFRLFSDHIRNKHPELFDKNNLYTCRHCDMIFSSNFEKLTHMKKCDAKVFTCENHCNKRFATVWLLKNHMKFVYGENGFSCEICGKRCVSKSDLQIHCRSHTNERPYSCPICHKSFKTSANRSSHLDIHEREKRHECEVCGKFLLSLHLSKKINDFNFRRKISNSSNFTEAQKETRRKVSS